MKKILYIGNALQDRTSNPSYMFFLGSLLEKEGYKMTYASKYFNKVIRLLDMIWSVLITKAQFVLIDTYSTQNFYYAYLVSQLCRFLRIEYIPILHGGNLPYRLKNSKYLSKQLFSNATVNISPSLYLDQAFKTNGYTNISYIPNALMINDYDFSLPNTNKISLLWVRAFSGIYNPFLAIRVLVVLKEKGYEANLCMVGPDKDGSLEKVQQAAKEAHVDVSFLGKLSKSEWIDLAREYTIFINTTNIDNTPVSVIEAMALGLPVVSTNVGGMPYLIDHNENGLLVDPDDPQAMAEAIIRLHENQKVAEQLAVNARKKVEQFDCEIVKEQWKELLG